MQAFTLSFRRTTFQYNQITLDDEEKFCFVEDGYLMNIERMTELECNHFTNATLKKLFPTSVKIIM